VDATVVAEAPKIGPHIPAMRAALAEVLGIAEDRVNVKGTTAKGLGALGTGEGIAAFVVATVRRRRATRAA
jgi:2-C-methyl-D-erythritol 2,4-cyclodiphosphate synthase